MKIMAERNRWIISLVALVALMAIPFNASALKTHQDSDWDKDSCESEERVEYTLQQIFDMTGAPMKGQIEDITGKGDGFIVTLKGNPNTAKVFDGFKWTDQTFTIGANEGISVLEAKCKNSRELGKGDLLVLNNGTVTAYEHEGTELVPSGVVIYGLPQYSTSLATMVSEGKCKLGVYQAGQPYMTLFSLNGSIATDIGQKSLPALDEAINGIEAYPGSKIIIATDNAVRKFKQKNGAWVLEDAAALKDGTPAPLPDGSICTVHTQCQSNYCNIIPPNPGTCSPPHDTNYGIPCITDANCTGGLRCAPDLNVQLPFVGICNL